MVEVVSIDVTLHIPKLVAGVLICRQINKIYILKKSYLTVILH